MIGTMHTKHFAAHKPQDVYKIVLEHKVSVVFLDVDDTLLAPKSATLRQNVQKNNPTALYTKEESEILEVARLLQGPYCVIDAIKADPTFSSEEKQERIAAVRSRLSQLVHEDWPETINRLKEKCAVYGCTTMDTGSCGKEGAPYYIPSVPEWRWAGLNNLGISFSLTPTEAKLGESSGPCFFKGIILTGKDLTGKNYTKPQAIDALWPDLPKEKILCLIDDRKSVLDAFSSWLIQTKRPGLTIHYKGITKLDNTPSDPELSAWQRQRFWHKAQWFEDEEAYEEMKFLKHTQESEI
jgi:hypothetical protein